MTRKPIPTKIETAVLVSSRRRCCICFGLTRDTRLKVGQIAHLDQNNANTSEDNLAFLCLEHHDEYDSRTSQRKGLTIGEVKQFRDELHNAIGKKFSIDVHFGTLTIPIEDPYAGKFIRIGSDNSSADISLTPIPDDLEGYPRYAITGLALWGTDREFGPNFGQLDFVGILKDGVIEHHGENSHVIRLKFEGERLIVEEDGWLGNGIYGMNVDFIGEYQKA